MALFKCAMKQQKPHISKKDAAPIAVRFAQVHGLDVRPHAEVAKTSGKDWWWVFVSESAPRFDPGGVLVRVHKQTGDAEFEISL